MSGTSDLKVKASLWDIEWFTKLIEPGFQMSELSTVYAALTNTLKCLNTNLSQIDLFRLMNNTYINNKLNVFFYVLKTGCTFTL